MDRIRRIACAGLVLGALGGGAPIATADGPATASQLQQTVADSGLATEGHSVEPKGVRVVRVAANRGFDWADAGIGAGAVVALGAIGLGAGVLVSSRRHKNDRPATAG